MRIREIRKSRGITRAQLGSRIGLPQCEISRIERGRRTLSVPRLTAVPGALTIARVLALELVDLSALTTTGAATIDAPAAATWLGARPGASP